MSEHDHKVKRATISSGAVSQTRGKSLSIVTPPKTAKFSSLNRLRTRRQSYGFSGVPSVGGQMRRRSSTIAVEFRRPVLTYLPTYQLEPRVRFNVAEVTTSINSILDSLYDDNKYNATEAPIKILLIADEVMRMVKEMNFDRYRIIAVVTLAQKRAQSYNNAVAFLWDHEFDNVVDVHREDSKTVTYYGDTITHSLIHGIIKEVKNGS